MQLSIGFSGPAGTGIVSAGLILSKLLARKGYYVWGDKEYESRIRGGDNLFVVYISDEDYFISKKIDHFFYFTEYGLEKNSKVFDIMEKYEINRQMTKRQNVYAVGMASKILGIEYGEVESLIKEMFKKDLETNLESLKAAYQAVEKKYDLKDLGEEREVFDGNELIAEGAIDSGLERYSAYPMTPASTIIETIVKHPDKVQFFQGEDEIAVSMSMLGAHFAGKRAMCGTSGGGFALMTESISYSNQAELGGVWVLSQRAGPSTGTPTYTEQGDLSFALSPTFGNTYPIVLAPSSLEEGYELIGKALNWSDIYQHPVIFIVDKQFSESYFTTAKKQLKITPIERGKLADESYEKIKNNEFARYEVTEDGISYYSIPGIKGGEFIASSYEHDVYGATTEDPLTKKIMHQKRAKKMETFVEKEFNEEFYGYEIINSKANKFFVTWGINKLALKTFVKNNPERGIIVVKVIQPLDLRLKEWLENNFDKIEELKFVELNYSGQLQKHITCEFELNTPEWKQKITSYRKYENYPLFPEEL